MLRIVKAFRKDERGVALILVSIMLPVIIGFALLAIDMSRANNLHNDLQKAADAMAIAAAAELDYQPDALDRADRAIANLVENVYSFSDEGVGEDKGKTQPLLPAGITRRFLHSLPANDSDPITEAFVTTDPLEAEFVEVTVSPVDFAAIFPASFLTNDADSNTMEVGATAVAGFAGTVVCEMTPLFMCNPFEGLGNFHEIVNDENFYRKGIRLVAKGGSGAWGPGNFGFLRPSDDHGYGTPQLADDIARSHLQECVTTRGLHFRTGVPKPAVEDAINVRFDIYNGQMKNTDATIPPAPNVRKGYKYKNASNPNACNMDPATGGELAEFRQMTQDFDLLADPDKRLGSGDWDYDGYVAVNQLGDALAGFVDEDGSAYSNANPPSRWDLYVYESKNNVIPVESLGGETGEPACHGSPSTDPERRLIYGALVNCTAQEANLNGQSGNPVQAVGYASFFLTEPVGTRTGGDIFAEIVDIDGFEGRGTMIGFSRDDVVLFR